ncbi:MAG: hypothetical protein KAT44_12755, partial [Pirellulales bacterium]|nr:hypothetical protein [Pirellulales bacterium]
DNSGFTVATDGFDASSRTVTLDGGGTIQVDDDDVIGFSFTGPVATTRVHVADITDIAAGVLTNGVAGIPAGTRVVSVTADDAGTGGTIELDSDDAVAGSQPVTVSNADILGFGFNSATVVVDDADAIEIGGLVDASPRPGAGTGVSPGTTVLNTDPVTDIVTLSQVIDVEDGSTLFFGTRTFQLAHTNILPGTLSGTLCLDETAIQTFTVARDGGFTFTPVGDPSARAVDALATIDYVTGLITMPFDNVPTGTMRLELSYEHGSLSAATLGFSVAGEGGAMSLNKDAYRGADMYSTNPRNPGMRVVLPGPKGVDTQYFVRVRSQSAYSSTTTPAQYEAGLANPVGASSGRYELRIRERQLDEKAGSTVRYADIRFPTTGIDVIGLPHHSQLVGET